MYLTAQRVRRPSTGEEGLNAYFYLHQDLGWDGLPPQGIPDENPGTLARSSIQVVPPGNRVRSYLDIVAPDDTPWTEIRSAFIAFASDAQAVQMPWSGVVGRCLFRVEMDAALASQWQAELAELYRVATTVRIDG